MKKALTLLLALFSISCVSALAEPEYQNAFLSWTRKYSKVYSSVEFNNRYSAFKANLDYVNQWNANNKDTVLGTTVWADLTNEEYKRIVLGTKFDGSERLAKAQASNVKAVVSDDVPTSIDWVEKQAVTAIKNQGQCGSCWSFSTTGSVEGIHQIKTGNLVSLSEQNLIDCSGAEGNNGCNGGLMDQAFQYIIKNGGIDTEESYPYVENPTKCKYSVANKGASISGFTDVTAGSETALMTAAATQPISVAIDASHPSFQNYLSGVYYEAACSTSALDHGVLVVGYGTQNGKDFWKVKNSWGTTWGEAGYILMSRNKSNNCGVATMASFPKI